MLALSTVGSAVRSVLACRRMRPAQFQAQRDVAARRLIQHAYANVPYYRDLMDRHGLRPETIRGAADLSRIPVTTREVMQTLPDDRITARGVRPDRLIITTTSGATGRRITVRRTWLEQRVHSLFWMRSRHYFGLRPTHRIAAIAYARRGRGHGLQPHQVPLRALGLYRKHTIDCYREPEEIAREVYALRPDWVSGQAGAVARMGRFLLEEGWPPLRPRGVTVGGEMVTAGMRRDIARGFGAPVRTGYGSQEFGLIAWECKETGHMHVCDDSVVLELLSDGAPVEPGGRGEVVLTDLHSYAMPFIRYELGDLAVRGAQPCPCGLPFSTIKRLEGRTVDFFPLPDGRTLHPYALVGRILNAAPWEVRRWQLVQEARDRITLRVMPFRPPRPEEIRRVEEAVRPVLGPAVSFRVILVDDLEAGPGEKFRVYRSYVSNPPRANRTVASDVSPRAPEAVD